MPLLEEVLVQLKIQGSLDPINKAITRLGYNLRLAGRDMMRMSGSLRGLSMFLMNFAGSVFKVSEIFQDAMGDIMYALEDVLEASGVMDFVILILETLADTIDRFPIIGLAMGVAFLVGIFVLLASKVFMVLGFMNLLTGTVLSARRAHLSLMDTVRLLTAVLTGNTEAYRQNIAARAKLAALSQMQADADKAGLKAIKNIKGPLEELNQLEAGGDAEGRASGVKKLGKMIKGSGKSFKKGIKTVGGLALKFGILAGFMLLLQPIMETMAPLFESFGGVVEGIIGPMEPYIDAIANMIEENPELAATFFAAILALVSFLYYIPKLVKGLGEGIESVSKFIDKMPSLDTAIKNLRGSFSSFKDKVSGAFTTLKTKFLDWKDSVISGFSSLKSSFSKLASTIKSKLIDIGSSMSSFAKKAGGKILDFFALMTRTIYAKVAPALLFLKAHWVEVGIGVAAAVGVFIAISALLDRLPAHLKKPISALVAIVGFLIAAAVAWIGYHAAQAGPLSPVIIPMIMAAAGAGVAGLYGLVSMERLAAPVEIGTPTLALLHPGEEVHPKGVGGRYQSKEPPLTITVDVTGAGSMEDIIRRAVEASATQIAEQLERKYRRKEY